MIDSVIDKKYSIGEYKNIFHYMSDEKSKKILFHRVMFDNTNDVLYSIRMIKDMYLGTSFLSKTDRQMYQYLDETFLFYHKPTYILFQMIIKNKKVLLIFLLFVIIIL